MSLQELESKVVGLSQADIAKFALWFEEFKANRWDDQIADDFRNGRLDEILAEVDAEIDAGLAQPL